jgi:F-type H+-transporting ATPase subunit c
MMLGVAIAFVGLALGVPIAVLGGAAAQGRAAAAALEGLARQPEAAGEIRILLIISLALIESLVIYALLTFFLLMGRIGEMLSKVQGA